MAGISHCPAAPITYCATDLFAARNLSARDDQISPRIGKTKRHGSAEASAAASDENHPSLQIDDVFVHLVAALQSACKCEPV